MAYATRSATAYARGGYATRTLQAGPSRTYYNQGWRSGYQIQSRVPSPGVPGNRAGAVRDFGPPGNRAGAVRDFGVPGNRAGTFRDPGFAPAPVYSHAPSFHQPTPSFHPSYGAYQPPAARPAAPTRSYSPPAMTGGAHMSHVSGGRHR